MSKKPLEPTQVTFNSGVSNFSAFKGSVLVGLFVPAGFTATAITFNTRDDVGTSYPVRNATTTLSITVDGTSASFYDLSTVIPYGVEGVQLVAASAPNGAVVKLLTKPQV